jgi:hypothetical protein
VDPASIDRSVQGTQVIEPRRKDLHD